MDAPERRHLCATLVVLVGTVALMGCLSGSSGAVAAGDTAPVDALADADAADASDATPIDTTAPADTRPVSETAPVVDTAPVDTATYDTTPVDTGAPASTCAARCGTYAASASCQCDAACTQYGNCCADYAALCGSGSAATDFLVAQGSECADPSSWFDVTHVRDGDTVDLASGDAVRFLLVDTPELSTDDCEAWPARDFTVAAIAASGSRVCLVRDPTSTDRDLYDRLLRYVYVRDAGADGQPINLNVRLIRIGYGRLLYPYAAGRVHEPEGKAAQAGAKVEGLGGWGSCGW